MLNSADRATSYADQYDASDHCTAKQIALARRRARCLENARFPRSSTLATTQKIVLSTRPHIWTAPRSCLQLLGMPPLQHPSDHHIVSSHLHWSMHRQSDNHRHPSGVLRKRSCPDRPQDAAKRSVSSHGWLPRSYSGDSSNTAYS